MFAEIGSKIKRLRTEKELTLKELSNLTNLSVGFLSQLERGLTTVAIDSLDNISKVLDVEIGYFFQMNKETGNIVTKSYERQIVFMDKDNFIQYHLSANLYDKKLFPRIVEILPKKGNEKVKLYGHEGEEFVYILEGILTYYYSGERYELYPGDSVHINSTSSHNWENNTGKTVKLIMVSIPNQFSEPGN